MNKRARKNTDSNAADLKKRKVTFPTQRSLEESCSFHPNTKKISAARMWQCTNIVCGSDNGVEGAGGGGSSSVESENTEQAACSLFRLM